MLKYRGICVNMPKYAEICLIIPIISQNCLNMTKKVPKSVEICEKYRIVPKRSKEYQKVPKSVEIHENL